MKLPTSEAVEKEKHSPLREKAPFLFFALLLPLLLIGLFYLTRNQVSIMLWWSNHILPPLAHSIGKLTAVLPFSLGEFLIILSVFGLIFFLVRQIYLKIRKGKPLVTVWHCTKLCAFLLWLWAGICWLWNPLYYIPSFAQRGDLDLSPYPVEKLIAVTEYFAKEAAYYSTQVPRNENLIFSMNRKEYFESSLDLYAELEKEFPFLAMDSVTAKPLTLSYLQSWFGFTGVYIPFTGEANINIHTPQALHPVTIAHEMAHQRMVAPELEANFLAVAACSQSDDPVFLYSGYLFGLIQLCNALFPVDSDSWYTIADAYFTPELVADWNENNRYWQSFQSPVEDVAKDVYDNFLKSNAQELGIRSYGACVDLLVAYFYPKLEQ